MIFDDILVENIPIIKKFFLNPIGLFGLAALIPLIILYLIRPKPHQQMIPSLMFLMKKQGRTLKSSFFRRLIHNILLYLQIFVIILIALAWAQPFIMVSEDSLVGNTIIVLDASASMHGSRFQEARNYALSNLAGINTIILAKDVPEVVLKEGSQTDARTILNNIDASDTGTNLFDAIKTAESLVKEKTKIIIISDFIDTSSPASYETAIRSLRSQGHIVDIKNIFHQTSNVGITDLTVAFPTSSVTIKNYDQEKRDVRLIIKNFSKEFSLEGGDVKILDFDTPLGLNEVKIETNDEFKADNIVYIATPKKEKINILLVSNNPNQYLLAALEENNEIDLEIQNPPTISTQGYDVIIIGDVDSDKILPGTIRSMIENTESGGAGIILAHNELKNIDYQGLFNFGDIETEKITGTHPITSEIEFGSEKFISSDGNSLAGSENNTAISFVERGNGKIMYYGILDEDSGFKFRLNYPIFWKDSINFLLNRKKINEINTKTGRIVTFENPTRIITPSGEVNTDKIVLDKAGFYDFGNFVFAANLLDFEESNVNKEVAVEEVFGEIINSREEMPLILSFYIFLILIGLIFLETIYVKYRGDV